MIGLRATPCLSYRVVRGLQDESCDVEDPSGDCRGEHHEQSEFAPASVPIGMFVDGDRFGKFSPGLY